MNHAPRNIHGRVGLAAAGLAAALSLAGCASASAPSGAAPTVTVTASPTGSASAASSASTPASSAPTTSAPTTSSTGYRVDRCDTAVLKGSLTGDGGAAGSTYYDLQLQNTGEQPCTLQGWPGVSLITGAGQQIGAAADFDRGSAHQTVTLQPDAHAHALLRVAQALNFPKAKCDPTTASHLRVYPPGSKASLTITTGRITACTDASVHLLTVQALHATT